MGKVFLSGFSLYQSEIQIIHILPIRGRERENSTHPADEISERKFNLGSAVAYRRLGVIVATANRKSFVENEFWACFSCR